MQSITSHLAAQIGRLYLLGGALPEGVLEQRMRGHAGDPVALASAGSTRAIVIPFRTMPDAGEAAHWSLLCSVANALQAELGLPAPAVSISGSDGFHLWLSLESPAPVAQVQAFLDALRQAYFPGNERVGADAAVDLPPCLHAATGKWAAFINPGLGASFAEDSGLEMAPPLAGQAALLEGLHGATAAQLAGAIAALGRQASPAPAASAPAGHVPRAASAACADKPGLLLADATIEDIVRHLHGKHIEPSFRYLIPGK